MYNKLKIIAISLFMIFVYSCDEIENPLKEQTETTCGDETLPVPIKKILVEDYTGHYCPNCPKAAEILHEIKDDYCDHIIPIALHVSIFAEPHETIYTADYRTEAGTELFDFYGIASQGLPNGLIARKPFENNTVIGKDSWRAAVNTLHKAPPEAQIDVVANYDEAKNLITGNISVEILQNLNYELNIGIYITEDSIVSPQKLSDGFEENYVHRHMLRKAVNGAFGEKIASSATKGEKLEKTFSFEPNKDWNIKHCEIIAFLSNTETKEILQAESEHVK